ncbi:MAG TPA: M20 family metallo-hydrolase, partial [Candidatus Ozemobacteraceae bacterium]|nr:M20 family metallo-hydrolase [Candidatus Ozemobacteraceae bacterium]
PHEQAKGGVRPNLIARYRGKSQKKTIWIMSHLDIVPPGDLSKWDSDPYKLRIDGDRLYGRGTEDNHQGLVASLLCVKAMMDCGHRPAYDIGLLFAADEETGSAYGAGYLVEKHPTLFGKDDMFIVPDGGYPDASLVEVAEKSIWWLKIRATGKQCHASMPHQGKNAFRAASALVVKLNSLYQTFARENPLFDPPISTFEPTKKEANVPNINTIPGDDVFYLDSRVLPEYPLSEVDKEIRRLAAEVEKEYGVSFAFETIQQGNAAPPTSPDAEIVTGIIGGIKKVWGITPSPKGIGGGTVAAFFRTLQLPAVVYSKQDEVAHQPNEYCILSNLIGDAQVFAHTILHLK